MAREKTNYAERDKNEQVEREERIKSVVPYIRELVGERSIRQASKDIGITSSYLSGVLKGRYLPTVEMLRKMTNEKASPQNGVTLEDLMVVAGYQQNYVIDMASKVIEYEESNEEFSIREESLKSHYTIPSGRMNNYKERVEQAQKYEKAAEAICLLEISKKNIMSAHIKDPTDIITGYKPHVMLTISEQLIEEWWMDFLFCPNDYGMSVMQFRNLFGRLITLPPKEKRKFSYVTNNSKTFDRFIHYKGKLSYRGDLSIILVDTEKMCLLNEVYLAHYCENSTDSELYIV